MATRIGLLAEVGGEMCRVKRGGGLLGGYMCDILTENLSERELNTYMCPRCEGIMKDGSISNVGEHFCACCIEEGERLQCNAPIYSTILSLKCSCPLSKRGCDWLGTLGSIEDHLSTCGYVYVSCGLKCGMVLKHDKMSWHVREECPFREESCMHCSEKQKVCEMAEHVKTCEMVEIECELGCGTRVRRESIMSHRNSVCLEEMVVCPYAKYRCEVAGLKRRELEQHLEESRMLHMEMKLDKMAEKIKMLEFQITMKNERIQHLEEECQIRTEGTVKWNIPNIQAFLKPRKGPRYSNAKRIAGYPFYLGHESTDDSFDIFFYTGLKYLMKENIFEKLELLDWPLRVIFITRVICRENLESSLTLKSPLVELLQTDFGKLFSNSKPICTIPLSTNWENFIQSETLYLEVTLRILKNKY